MNVDYQLQFSNNYFNRSLETSLENVEGSSFLERDPYPSHNILAQLALKVYINKGKSSDSDYETKLKLEDDWKLLTTASNPGKTNGYYGAAFWHPFYQQVVIAHRGTVLTDTGAMVTNFMGVMFNNLTSRMSSAITFADKVKSVLRQVNKSKRTRFSLSVTGHSLGGWLGQVTTFSLQYLQRKNDKFVKISDLQSGLHVHTVVFDSPGSREILEEIILECDVRYPDTGKTVSFNRLDITNFLTSPNHVNTCGVHVGAIYRILIDAKEKNYISILLDFLKKFFFLPINSFVNTCYTHKIEHFVEFFLSLEIRERQRAENIDALEDEISNRKIMVVVDWPRNRKELLKYNANVNDENYFQPTDEEQESWDTRVRVCHEKKKSCNWRVFSEDELSLLKNFNKFQKCQCRPSLIKKFFIDHNLGNIENLLPPYEIVGKKKYLINCDTEKSLKMLIKRTKQLLRWFPELKDVVEQHKAEMSTPVHLKCNVYSQRYLRSLPSCYMDFKDFLLLEDFLKSHQHCILYIRTDECNFGVAVLYKILYQIKLLDKNLEINDTFSDWKGILDFEKFTDIGKLPYDLLVIDCASLVDVGEEFTNVFNKILKNMNTNNPNKKIVLITSQQVDLEVFLNSLEVSVKIMPFKHINLFDLAETYQVLTRKLFRGQMLKECLGTDCDFNGFLKELKDSLDTQTLKDIVTNQNYTIKIEDPLVNYINLDVNYLKINKKVSEKSVARVLQKIGTLVTISGISPEELRSEERWKVLTEINDRDERITVSAEDGQKLFKQKCRENMDKIIYWFHVSAEQVTCMEVFDKDFYIKRRFKHSRVIDLDSIVKFIEQSDVSDLLILQNVDADTLMNSNSVIKKKIRKFLKIGTIKIATSAAEVEEIFEKNCNRPVHFFLFETETRLIWQRSLGTLDGLRPFVTFDSADEPVEEEDLCDGKKKVVIIVGEPGVGKSTSLKRICFLMSVSFQHQYWVIHIDLKCLQTENLPPKFNSLSDVAKILLTGSNCNNNLLRVLLKYCLDYKNKNSMQVFLLFEAFHEIIESSVSGVNAQKRVIDLLKFLKDHTRAIIFVTSREGSTNILENELSMFSTEFEITNDDCQKHFLRKYFCTQLELLLEDFGKQEEEQLANYVKELHCKAGDTLDVNATRFIGIPLQMQMLAVVSLPEVKMSKIICKPFECYNIFELYQEFLKIKRNIYFIDKLKEFPKHPSFKNMTFHSFVEKHRIVSVWVLFPEFSKGCLRYDNDEMIELYRFGLIQTNQDRGVHFVHKTFMEYFCADTIIDGLVRKDLDLAKLFIWNVLLQSNCKLIRTFIEAQMYKHPTLNNSQYLIKNLKNLFSIKKNIFYDKHCQNILHVAANEKNHRILNFLLDILNAALTQNQYIFLLTALDENKRTVLTLAARNVFYSTSNGEKEAHRKIIEKIVRSVTSNTLELQEKFILATFSNNDETINKMLVACFKGQDICLDTKRAFDRAERSLKKKNIIL